MSDLTPIEAVLREWADECADEGKPASADLLLDAIGVVIESKHLRSRVAALEEAARKTADVLDTADMLMATPDLRHKPEWNLTMAELCKRVGDLAEVVQAHPDLWPLYRFDTIRAKKVMDDG